MFRLHSREELVYLTLLEKPILKLREGITYLLMCAKPVGNPVYVYATHGILERSTSLVIAKVPT